MLSERIKKARKIKNYTQEQLAEKINVTKQTIVNYEKNKQEPTFSKILQIAEICDVNKHWILTGEGKTTSKESNIPQIDIKFESNQRVDLNIEINGNIKIINKGE